MKIHKRTFEHFYLGDKYERTDAKWEINFDETELDPKMFERFKVVEVDQVIWARDRESRTGFKGFRTIWFNADTSDKQKKIIIEMIVDFMERNAEPMHYEWNSKIVYSDK